MKLLLFCLLSSSFAVLTKSLPADTAVTEAPPPQVNTPSEKKDECQDDSNCPQYNYCHHSYWIGSSCLTNLRPVNPPGAKTCSGTDSAGKTVPVHKTCVDHEVADSIGQLTVDTSTARCFPQLNFTCAKSYFMPCTPNYNADGSAITGQEESCPQSFSCTQKSYGTATKTEVKLCTPNIPKESNGPICKTAFDCGYSTLEDKWSACHEGECIRAVE